MNVTTDTWVGIIIGLVLLVFAVPAVARRAARADGDPWIFRVMVASGVLKLAAAPLYIYVFDHFYGGFADAYTYSHAGRQVAAQLRQGDLSLHVGKVVGDGATSIVTGIIYTIIGSHTLGGFFVFAFLSFCSLVMFYRAFRIALPDGDNRRYAKLLFFLPSLLFWTSAIGKDALISLGLGIASLGAARIISRTRGGFVVLAIGLAFTSLIRPHVALMFFVALAVAYSIGRSRRSSRLGPIGRLLGAVILLVGGLFLARVTAHFLGVSSLNASSVQHALQTNADNTGTAAQTQVGEFGSSTATSVSLSPAAIPKDIYYVLMRPLPNQAHGPAQLASSLESLFLAGLFVVSWRRLAAAFKGIRRQPYVLMAGLYSLVWVVLFASIGNLGILARERTTVLPLLIVLISLHRTNTATERSLKVAVPTFSNRLDRSEAR